MGFISVYNISAYNHAPPPTCRYLNTAREVGAGVTSSFRSRAAPRTHSSVRQVRLISPFSSLLTFTSPFSSLA